MSKIIILEDIASDAAAMRDALLEAPFESHGRGIALDREDFEIWHCRNVRSYQQLVARVDATNALAMVADLRLFNSPQQLQKAVACAREVVAEKRETYPDAFRGNFWTWEPDGYHFDLLPAWVLIECFARARPFGRCVAVCSTAANEAERWSLSLPLRQKATIVPALNRPRTRLIEIPRFVGSIFADWEHRLWGGAATWFRRDRRCDADFLRKPMTNPLPHNPSLQWQGRHWYAAEQRIWIRLGSVFGFEPPRSWFARETARLDTSQFWKLYKSLQSLVGVHSFAGDEAAQRTEPLCLANLPVILGIAMGLSGIFATPDSSTNVPMGSRLLGGVRWTDVDRKIMRIPSEETHKWIKQLIAVFRDLIVHNRDETRSTLLKVELAERAVALDLDFSCDEAAAGRTPLSARWAEGNDWRPRAFTGSPSITDQVLLESRIEAISRGRSRLTVYIPEVLEPSKAT